MPTSTTAAPVPVPIKLTYLLPGAAATPTAPLNTQSVAYRRLEYISTSNTRITVTVTPLGGSGTSYGPTACTTASCTISFTANPGPNTLAFSLTDGTNVLSSFSTLKIIQPSTLNTLNFTAKPVVHSVTLQLTSATENAGTPVNDLLTVNAQDSDGNTIIGNAPYVDVNGNPVSFSLNVSNNQAGGRGTVSILGPTVITAPGQTAMYAHYDGNWLASSTISVASTSSAVTSLTGATLTTTPYAAEYTAAGKPLGITSGPDGNIWFAENGASTIAKISTSGTNYTQYTCTGCTGTYYITNGPDGNLWFTEFNTGEVDKITTSGVVTRVANAGGKILRIVTGPDGNLWFSGYASGLGVGRITTAGMLTMYPQTGQLQGIGLGPDGNIWSINETSGTVGSITTSGSYLASYSIPSWVTGNNPSQGLVTGPDGNLWFMNSLSDKIETVTPGGVFSSYALQSGASPRDIVVGPDGYLWFTELGTNGIGRISTSGALTEYSSANGINALSSPVGITVGPDGNIWFAEYGSNTVAKFVL